SLEASAKPSSSTAAAAAGHAALARAAAAMAASEDIGGGEQLASQLAQGGGRRGNRPQRSAAPSGATGAVADPISEDSVEDALLELQLAHGALIHHTAVAVETARWVVSFTQHISTVPYRRQLEASMADAGFCMDFGQVRSGDGASDTYVRMLQEIGR